MPLQTMYPPQSGSTPTTLTALASATATTLTVASAAVLPAAPGLITLGREENAEVVQYAAISGNKLTGCVRGFGGTTAQIWPSGTEAYRAYTAYDHQTFLNNLQTLETTKLATDASAADLTVPHTATASVTPLVSGEKLATSLGKMARWYLQLGKGAWANFGTTNATIARGDHTHANYATIDADGKLTPAAASAKSVAVTTGRALTLADAGRCLDATASAAITITIPTDLQAAFPLDTEIEITQEGVGAVTIQAASGVTLCGIKGAKASYGLSGRYGVAALKKKGANDWRVSGDVQ